jgi:hypothetical protein
VTPKRFDRVALLRDSEEVPTLRAGAIGTVVDVSQPDALMLEFLMKRVRLHD